MSRKAPESFPNLTRAGQGQPKKEDRLTVSFRLGAEDKVVAEAIAAKFGATYGGQGQLSRLIAMIARGELEVRRRSE